MIAKPNLLKNIYEKPKVNIILNGEILNAFLLRSETRQRMSTLTILFNILLMVLDKAIRKEKEVKYVHIGKEKINHLSLQIT